MPDFDVRDYDLPEHTCGGYHGNPTRGCPGCEHVVNRFGELWPIALTCAVEDETGEVHNNDEAFDASFPELYALGLMPPVWYTCAVAVTQLADGPSTLDRRRLWGSQLDNGVEPGLPVTLDLVDRLLLYSGLDDRTQCLNTIMRMAALPVKLQAAVQLSLCAAAHASLHSKLSLWQLVIHTGLLADVWPAPGRPQEALMAARITGARADGDTAQADQLMRRAARQGFLGGTMLMMAYAIAARMPNPDMVTIMKVRGGEFSYVLNTHADLDTTDDVEEQGFMLAARAVRAVKSGTPNPQIAELLREDTEGGRSRAMISAMSTWHLEVVKTVYADFVAQRQADWDAEHADAPAAPPAAPRQRPGDISR